MNWYEYVFLVMAALLGGGLALWLRRMERSVMQLVLSFCGAYLFGVIVLHLLPSIYEGGEHHIGIWVLGGFVLQLLLEQLSQGVEHGHIHEMHGHSRKWQTLQVMFGLSVHAFLEGMPLEGYQLLEHAHTQGHPHIHLLSGVMMHKVPEAFSLTFLLLISGVRTRIIIGLLALFSLMTPAGAWLAQAVVAGPDTVRLLMAIVVGSLLHIATTILFEADSAKEHHISFVKWGAIILGIGLSLLSLL